VRFEWGHASGGVTVTMTIDAVADARGCFMQGEVNSSFSPFDLVSNPMSLRFQVVGMAGWLWTQ